LKKVVFFVRKFPVLSQTFVIDQINGLIEQGADVEIVSFYKEHQEVQLDSLQKYNLLDRTRFLAPSDAIKVKKPLKLLYLIKFFIAVKTSQPSMKDAADLVIYALKKNNINLAYEVAVTLWNNRSLRINADSIIAHFGNNGVVAQKFISAGILTGKLYTVFHGYEISEYESIAFWKQEYVKLSEKSNLLPISNFWKNRLEKWGAKPSSIAVHRMGVDIQKFDFKDRPFSKQIQIVSVARATEKKGLEYAIKAMSYLDDTFHLSLIGGGALEDKLIQMSKELGVSHRITFHGPKTPQFVKETLDDSDIFLLPSVIDSMGDMEGVPVALMEAMASGLLVLSTFHSGIPELIDDGINGFLVPEKDPESIAKAITKITTLESLTKIRTEARKKVETEFNSRTLARELYEMI